MLAKKAGIFGYVHKSKQPTALIDFKRLASSVRCSFCKGVFNLRCTTLLGRKGDMP
jgi:LSD1 subclass zinc finger protein